MGTLKLMTSVWWKMTVDASPKSHNGANVDVKLNQRLHHLSAGPFLAAGLSY